MKESKHTQGPWEAYDGGGTWQVCQPIEGTMRICTVTNSENDADNAQLIAAAPELLEACKILNKWAENNHLIGTKDEPPGIAEAQAAIAKAEGRTHGPR